MPDEIITIPEALGLYRRLTGRRLCRKYLEEQLHAHRHLARYNTVGCGSVPQLTGVRRHAWEYFVKTRLLLRGAGGIFNTDDE